MDSSSARVGLSKKRLLDLNKNNNFSQILNFQRRFSQLRFSATHGLIQSIFWNIKLDFKRLLIKLTTLSPNIGLKTGRWKLVLDGLSLLTKKNLLDICFSKCKFKMSSCAKVNKHEIIISSFISLAQKNVLEKN